MSRQLQYLKEGWRPHGPGKCRCPKCGGVCSTNALARAKHVCETKPKPQKPNPSPRGLMNLHDETIQKLKSWIEA